MPTPLFSVVVPLVRDRGYAAACIASWLNQTTNGCFEYEVIAVTNGGDPTRDEAVGRRLRNRGRLIRHESRNEFDLFNAGARHARGEFLFFVESHSLGEPDCLSRMWEHLEARKLDGARCRTVGAGISGLFAKLYLKAFEEFDSDHLAEGDWRKVLIHGFAIRRDVFLAEGSFQARYGQFAQTALAARLHHHARRIGYAELSAVKHYYGNLREAEWLSEDYTRGEIAYRAEHAADPDEAYLESIPEWSGRGDVGAHLPRALALAVATDLAQSLADGRDDRSREGVRNLVAVGPPALLGAAWQRARLRLDCYRALSRVWLTRDDEDGAYEAYRDYLSTLERYHRVGAIATQSTALRQPPAQAAHFEVVCLPEDSVTGFLPREHRHDQPFRWSSPAAAVALPVPCGDYDLRLELAPFRPGYETWDVRAYLDGTQLHQLRKRSSEGAIVFAVERTAFKAGDCEHTLVLLCRPYRPSLEAPTSDQRVLGLPLRAIEFVPYPARAIDSSYLRADSRELR